MSSRQRDKFRAGTLGVIFQQFNLLPYLSVLDNVVLALEFSNHRTLSTDEKRGRAKRLLTALGLDGDNVLQQKASQLSVGQQQRVAAARAFVGSPPLIIADEPTSALDEDRRLEFLELLFAQQQQTEATLLMVTHDRRVADRFDRVLDLLDIWRHFWQPGGAGMIILRLALQSLRNRRITALLTVLSITLSVVMLLGVEKIRAGTKASFLNTIAGTDLIVGARAGDVQLLLYSIFRIGDATANITWATVEDIRKRPEVKWVVPIALGDSHRGFRVMGTSTSYFDHYRYRRNQALEFSSGDRFDDLFEAVIGHKVAQQLGYEVGSEIVVAHGSGPGSVLAQTMGTNRFAYRGF